MKAPEKDDAMSTRRLEMVKRQIEKRGIEDPRVLAAMKKVPRHLFVPPEEAGEAYEDTPLPIGHGQTISQPYIVALMTELLALERGDKVLEIGTGSGYQSAVLAELVDRVYTVEIVKPLGERAKKLLERLGYRNIEVRIGDGYKGWPEQAPFDAIIVTAAPETIPQPLVDQLAEGGRMVIPVGKFIQELMLLEKTGGKTVKRSVTSVRFVPMVGEED